MEVGRVIDGKYIIEKVIGQGGMSTVYLARDKRLGKKWAIKEICPDKVADSRLAGSVVLDEAQILKRLDHPGLPYIVDVLCLDESIVIIMEYIQGRTLRDLLQEEGLVDEKKVIEWGISLCDVLDYLHTRTPPIIYRDMKPSNIMLREDGKLTLIDFGTAREYSLEASADTVCLGTRGYAAPEQYGGESQTDFRTDIYSLGVTLYQLMTGKDPQAPPYRLLPVREVVADASSGIEEIIDKCTRSDPEERYKNCQELKYALCYLEESSGIYRKKQWLKVAAAGIMFSLSILCFLMNAYVGYCESDYRSSLAAYWVKKARESSDDKESKAYFAKALGLAPDYYPIYEELLYHYCEKEVYTAGDEAAVVSLTGLPAKEGTCIEMLKKKREDDYCRFCYYFGLASFYQIGGDAGKQRAEIWFKYAGNTNPQNTSYEERKRAVLYRKICEFHRNIPEMKKEALEESGDRDSAGSFRDLFCLLSELNKVRVDQKSGEFDILAAFLISKEVLIEISEYAGRFYEEGITVDQIQKELERIKPSKVKNGSAGQGGRMVIFENRRDRKECDELEMLLIDCQRKLLLINHRDEQEGGG